MKMEQCSETLAYKIQTLGNYPEESIQQEYCSLHFVSLIAAVTVTALLENCHHIVTDKMEMCDILYFLILPQKAGKIQCLNVTLISATQAMSKKAVT